MAAPGRVALVVVSHSEALATAAAGLAAQMAPPEDVVVELAAGVDDGGLGTDAVRIKDALERCDSPAGVLVLVDLGSAVLSTELALDLLDDPTMRDRVVVSAGPLVEGLVAAAVTAAGGGTLREVADEAAQALDAKRAHLGDDASEVGGPAVPSSPEGPTAVGTFTVRNPHGLHARPAARLVAEVRGLGVDVGLADLTTGTGPVSAASLSRVATLGALQGHELEVRATGPGAEDAVAAILALAARDFDESAPDEAPAPPPDPGPAGAERGPRPGAPGVAVGPARRLTAPTPEAGTEPVGTPEAEWTRWEAAVAVVREQLEQARTATAATVGAAEAAVFDAHLLLLEDPEIRTRVRAGIQEGAGAAAAWSQAVEAVRLEWAAVPDDYLRERAADVAAVGRQVVHELAGGGQEGLPAPGVLVATDLTPLQLTRLDPAELRGVVLAEGSATSHVAILARARAVPMVLSAGPAVLEVPDGTTLALDGSTGELVVGPAPGVLAQWEARAGRDRDRQAAQRAAAGEDAVSADGVRVVVGVNVGSVADATTGRSLGADEAGLVRTELLFLDRPDAPGLEEQVGLYEALLTAMDGRRVVLRTLDVGGDKPLAYLPAPVEANPFLGRRGVRFGLHHPELLRTQLRAMVRAAGRGPVSVMVPMVSTPAELREVRSVLEEEAGGGLPSGLRFGMMVEVPSAALKLAAFLPHLDFVSIGTNDLTQYAMAAERGNPAVADLGDPLDPGVLRLVDHVVRAASGQVAVAVCGEAAADPVAVPVLLGLGVRELSVAPPFVPAVKDRVRGLDVVRCGELARRALDLADAAEVRRLVAEEVG